MEPRRHRVRWAAPDGFHDLAWTHWGAPSLARTAICVHGLTRTGRDFDALARQLVLHGWQVACPDLPGRGESEWLDDKMLYVPPIYVGACAHLLAALGWRSVAWVGTSLGGIVGMLTASMRGTPITRLVLNDVGPMIPAEAAARIRGYVGTEPAFRDLPELEAHLRRVHAPFGPLTDAEWWHLASTSSRSLPDGRVGLHYDPGIALPLHQGAVGPTEMWPVWNAITAPTLVLRGETSDLLLPETLARMAERPGVETETIAGCGHAPALMDWHQIARVSTFLDG
jgi:pimeloyl-ACP methyl ester carboxylesterase